MYPKIWNFRFCYFHLTIQLLFIWTIHCLHTFSVFLELSKSLCNSLFLFLAFPEPVAFTVFVQITFLFSCPLLFLFIEMPELPAVPNEKFVFVNAALSPFPPVPPSLQRSPWSVLVCFGWIFWVDSQGNVAWWTRGVPAVVILHGGHTEVIFGSSLAVKRCLWIPAFIQNQDSPLCDLERSCKSVLIKTWECSAKPLGQSCGFQQLCFSIAMSSHRHFSFKSRFLSHCDPLLPSPPFHIFIQFISN